MNKDGTRLRDVPASADLNDLLLLVVTGLNWLHGVRLRGARNLPMWVKNGGSGLRAKAASSHHRLRRVGSLHC